ncbi:hypothetical protein OHA40_18080 [Nocardia sp. NBC_00508]|uniref:hypothetical protein n=1 Tax=Nocardia sp. NBC_00508 TaxID=2975992 RepID=UPI002E800E10|nr:hypothetical protein [Nocardia sp. NBC_00508]WUD63681.1 hypothetical protein OHA40_18080 [Nocardia sp. NBC_00508]
MTGTAFSSRPAPLHAPVSAPPRPVRVAFSALVVALLAGIAEAIVRAALAFDEADPADLATGFGMRLAIYLAVLAVAVRVTRGDRWARLVITVGIGGFGLLSLIIEPLAEAISAKELRDLFADLTPASVSLGVFRAVHVAAVLIAIPALYTRPARRYFHKR